jgi:hypothetical protein
MKVNRAAIDEAVKKLSNWGRWGKDDQIGTLNNVTPEDVINAGKLIKKGKGFSLGLSLKEPIQSGLFGGRWNPIHTMLATGTDAVAGNQDTPAPYLRYADDAINMPCQASTQWDALCHIFYGDKMYNGYDATLVDARGAKKLGIENVRDKMAGRGVLLDMARFKGVASLRRIGAATLAATPPVLPSRPATGSRRRMSPRSARIPGDAKSVPTRPTRRISPGTGW